MITERYFIIAKCDPYNARKHYHGETIIKGNNGTPVAWVREDGSDIASFEEAQKMLYNCAFADLVDRGDFITIDDAYIAELRNDLLNDGATEEEAACEWYKGEGIYYGTDIIMKKGDTSYEDDSMTFTIWSESDINTYYDYYFGEED